MMNNIMERTTEIKMTAGDLNRIRQNWAVCSHCGTPFVKDHESFKVCEICTRDAMEAEGFTYRETNILNMED